MSKDRTTEDAAAQYSLTEEWNNRGHKLAEQVDYMRPLVQPIQKKSINEATKATSDKRPIFPPKKTL